MSSDPIRLEVSLSDDGLCVHLPRGRMLRISASEAGARFLRKMLQDAEAHRKYDLQQRGYIGGFPTQELTDRWHRAEMQRQRLEEQARAMIAEDKQRKAEAKQRAAEAKAKQAKRVWAKRGIDTSKIKISI